jgi:iron complex outermembrane recepter protein
MTTSLAYNRTARKQRRWIAAWLVSLALATLRAADATAQGVASPQEATTAEKSKSGDLGGLLDLPIEQLAKTPVSVGSSGIQMESAVTSVTKEASTVGKSAAAVFVITNEMIRRSGVTSIPDALRLAPGLDVEQANSSTWAISSRGFTGPAANKLLVLIDGRTVYSPVFSGVYWTVQDVLLEDVDRIEVIRGPGGTLWGANAVNGVINIITKSSKSTQGSYMSAGGGTVHRAESAARYGGQIGETGTYRVYGKYFDNGPFYDPTGPANDAWNQGRVGFRTDFEPDRDKSNLITIQGDHYVGQAGKTVGLTTTTPPFSQTIYGAAQTTGQNVLARWKHIYDEERDWTLQTYYDQFDWGTDLNSEKVKTWDVDYEYRFHPLDRHQITCGAGYRYIHAFCPSEDQFTLTLLPDEQSTYVVNQYIQDEIALQPDRWKLILGCKLEENPYTAFEYQPTARLLWTPDERHSVWGAVSRAVRVPAMNDRSIFGTIYAGSSFRRVLGNPDIESESLFAYELGYRTQVTDKFSWDLATFYNVYDGLETRQNIGTYTENDPPPPHAVSAQTYVNGSTADSYGAELATHWGVTDYWRLDANYTFLRVFIHNPNAFSYTDGDSPRHQVSLRSSWDLRKNLELDATLRYVDCLATLNVPAYITMDMRLAWRPKARLELAVVGQNLLQPHHFEYSPSAVKFGQEVTEVPRGMYGTATWRY